MAELIAHACYGIDIGGTKIELVACDAAMQVIWRRRVATPQGDYDGFLQAVVTLVAEADAALGRSDAAIGIALPGVRDRRSGRQLSANVPALTGHSVAADLQARLQRPLHFGNDLQCFALSEAHGGAADGYHSMFGAILGTGAGGGFCLQGRLLSGFNGLAGEWGHWSVPGHLLQRHGLPLIDCACGLQGCVERYVSGSGVAMIERHLGGSAIDASAVIALAETGDARARKALDIHRDLLGHSLAALVLALDPHVIVLGGGLSQYAPLYEQLPAAIAAHLFKGVQVPPIVPPRFGDAGGARGAALLACQPSFS
ncbi:ROK family protein [Stenotrophomonas maltophilia]|uniref:ROK family protein n=1 Tax=Stenotrophomonas TaxID=40323 RepID=UPI000D0BE263|nr:MULTISPECIES: ROK family protein [Stenotrophomonas]AVO32359.1 sugar kinase [Stenotrophomonas maltophilia]ELC7323646.1 ROK family protein [Stenotrophomonas maltophilia]MBA0278641.1 ROK family protein [Stenotrophomonas maltophilia]MBA0414068.1 ROK family protein [Stenotrophomonas maltophilia]MBA0499365.1 ROK family protein [Stenotrophomonas maltophilia]